MNEIKCQGSFGKYYGAYVLKFPGIKRGMYAVIWKEDHENALKPLHDDIMNGKRDSEGRLL